MEGRLAWVTRLERKRGIAPAGSELPDVPSTEIGLHPKILDAHASGVTRWILASTAVYKEALSSLAIYPPPSSVSIRHVHARY